MSRQAIPIGHEIERRPSECPTTHPQGRRCPDCEMPLSRFNAGPRCWPCQDKREEPLLELVRSMAEP